MSSSRHESGGQGHKPEESPDAYQRRMLRQVSKVLWFVALFGVVVLTASVVLKHTHLSRSASPLALESAVVGVALGVTFAVFFVWLRFEKRRRTAADGKRDSTNSVSSRDPSGRLARQTAALVSFVIVFPLTILLTYLGVENAGPGTYLSTQILRVSAVGTAMLVSFVFFGVWMKRLRR